MQWLPLMSGGVPRDPEPGQQVDGTVASISDSTVFVNIGAKSEGTIDRSTLADPDGLQVGDAVSAFVVRVGSQGIRLAEKLSGAGSREMLEEAFRGRIPVEGTVEGRIPVDSMSCSPASRRSARPRRLLAARR